MKLKLITYAHASNGLSLQLCPETEVEQGLLKSIWQHGVLETGHPCGEMGGTGFYIKVFCERGAKAKAEAER